MATYRRRSRIRAPLEAVWEFHSTTDGLEALTPNWMGLTVSSVHGPDGELDPEKLVEGTEISMQSKPFGVFPQSRWISRITDRREGEGYRMFRDGMNAYDYGPGLEVVVADYMAAHDGMYDPYIDGRITRVE